MTEEDFLKRWSRRKRQSAADKPAPDAQPSGPDAVTADGVPARADASADPNAPALFDPATLPPIDSITALSDVTAFLRAGVPAELTRAALRRVWTADPAIRDFVGLVENGWDFTDPNAMPGFGPLEATDEVRRMIAGIVDSIGRAAEPSTDEVNQQYVQLTENPNDCKAIETAEPSTEPAGSRESPPPVPAQNLGDQVVVQSSEDNGALQRDVAEDIEVSTGSIRRIHGSALPQ